jgi:uncharacterized protein (DUF433 family)
MTQLDPSFRGTRVMVSQVLKMIAKGYSWDHTTSQWQGISKEAIAEAVGLAQRVFEEHAADHAKDSQPACTFSKRTSRRIDAKCCAVGDRATSPRIGQHAPQL